MNMFELFKYGPQIIVTLTKDGLQVIFKLTKLHSVLIDTSPYIKIQSYIKRPARFARRPKNEIAKEKLQYVYSNLSFSF